MSAFITTYTGLHIEPADPSSNLICIDDIAHALSLLCRGNGHVKTFWSVGQHYIACAKEAAARGLPARIVLACLLHDASECYMSDVPRPIKQTLPAYREQEKRLLSVIYEKFLGSDLTAEEARLVKEIDDVMLQYDLEKLLGEKQVGGLPKIHIDLSYEVRPFADVEEEYLKVYKNLMVPGTINTINMSGTKRLETARLVLRQHIPADADFLYSHFGTDERMYAYSGWNPYATPEMARETVQRFIDSYDSEDFYGWAIELDGQMIGTIGAYDYDPEAGTIEAGISIDPEYWDRGLATEALQGMLHYLTAERHIPVVRAWCADDNLGSKNAMEKCGMRRTSVEEGVLKIGGRTYDKLNYEYGIGDR